MERPTGPSPEELQHLVAEARMLHERLHRVTVALALTEEIVADILERLSADGGPRMEDRQLGAKRARAAAVECRAFAQRLMALEPKSD